MFYSLKAFVDGAAFEFIKNKPKYKNDEQSNEIDVNIFSPAVVMTLGYEDIVDGRLFKQERPDLYEFVQKCHNEITDKNCTKEQFQEIIQSIIETDYFYVPYVNKMSEYMDNEIIVFQVKESDLFKVVSSIIKTYSTLEEFKEEVIDPHMLVKSNDYNVCVFNTRTRLADWYTIPCQKYLQ